MSPRAPALLVLAAALVAALPAFSTDDDGYVMGAGRWSCGEVIDRLESGDTGLEGQLVGWILGYWSAATFARETGFVDTVEQVGGRAIFDATVAECHGAPPDTPLYIVTKSMISNTK